jgi:hypothetical protein
MHVKVTVARQVAGFRIGTMDVLGWLILVLVVLLIAVVLFVITRRRRRGGGVIATRGKR